MGHGLIWKAASFALGAFVVVGWGGAMVGQPPGFLYGYMSPQMVYLNGTDTTTLRIVTSGGGIERVVAKLGSGDREMFDDGTHGDLVAGDGTYSLGGLTSGDVFRNPETELGFFDGLLGTGFANAEIFRSSGAVEDGFAVVGFVNPEVAFPAERLSDRLSATEYALFIQDPQGQLLGGTNGLAIFNEPAVAQTFYSVYGDEVDILVAMPSTRVRFEPDGYAELTPYNLQIRPPADFLGFDAFDHTDLYGSAGRLKAFVYQSWGAGEILEHELAHTWGTYFGAGARLLPDQDAHWNADSDIAGSLSNFVIAQEPGEPFTSAGHLRPNGDGTFRFEVAVPNCDKLEIYSPLEQYLMGLVPPEEVPPVNVLINPDFSNLNRITAERVETYSMGQLIALEGGLRRPPWPEAPTDFNVGFIMVSNDAFTPAEYAWMSVIAQGFTLTEWNQDPCLLPFQPFHLATGGRGTVHTRLMDFGDPQGPTGPPRGELPDLTGTVSVSGCFFPGLEDINPIITVRVSNQGGAAAAEFVVGSFLEGEMEGAPLATDFVPLLPAGETLEVFTFEGNPLPPELSPGDYVFVIAFDSTFAVEESNEDNNVIVQPVRVVAGLESC